MSITSRFAATFFICSALLSSCLLQSPEVNFRTLSPGAGTKPATITFSTDYTTYSPLVDSLVLDNYIYFKFLSPELVDFSILVDGNALPAGVTSLARTDFTPGFHKLKFIQHIVAHTGSLAELSGKTEVVEVTANSVLRASDPTDPQDPAFIPSITSVQFADGTVKITWRPYTKNDFVSNTLTMSLSGFSTPFNSITITDKNTTSINDPTFVGGDVDYRIILDNGKKKTSAVFSFYWPTDRKFYVTRLPSGKTRVTWDQPPFFANIESYSFSVKNVVYEPLPVIEQVDVDETFTFGEFTPIALTIHSRQGGEQHLARSSEVDQNFMPGMILPELFNVIHDPQDHYFYVFQAASVNGYPPSILYKIDDATFEVVGSIFNPFTLDLDFGKILISPNGNYHYLLGPTEIIRFDPATMTVQERNSIGSLANGLIGPARSDSDNQFGITNNNLVLFRAYDDANIVVVNMNTKTSFFSYNTNYLGRYGHISFDGRYLAATSAVYEFSGNSHTVSAILPYPDILYQQFLSSSPYHLLTLTSTSAIVFDCESNTEVLNYTLPTITSGSLDKFTNRVLLNQSDGQVRVLNLSDGSLDDPLVYTPLHYFLQNGTLFFRNGGPTNALPVTYGFKIY